MKTLNPNLTVVLNQMTTLKTQNQMRVKIIRMRKNNHHHQCNENIRKWGLQSQTDQTRVHCFMGGDRGKKQNKAPHINKEF
jgi:hypothetical protein